MRRTVLGLLAAPAVLSLGLAVGLVSGCTSSPPDARPPVTVTATATPTTAGTTTSAPSTTAATTAAPGAVPTTPRSTITGAGVSSDYGSNLRLDGDRLTYERLTWYTGDAADRYCQQTHPADACQMEYQVEDQHTVGSGTVDAATKIVLLAQTSQGIREVPSTTAALAAAVKDPQWSPYWRVQVSGGRITLVEHVYVP